MPPLVQCTMASTFAASIRAWNEETCLSVRAGSSSPRAQAGRSKWLSSRSLPEGGRKGPSPRAQAERSKCLAPRSLPGGWEKGSIAACPGRTVRMPGPQVVTWGVRGRAHRRAPIHEGARLFRSHREQMWKSRNSSFGELSPFRTILQARAGQRDTSHIPDGDTMLAEPNPKGFRHYQSLQRHWGRIEGRIIHP